MIQTRLWAEEFSTLLRICDRIFARKLLLLPLYSCEFLARNSRNTFSKNHL